SGGAVGAWRRASSARKQSTKPRLPTVQTHSRPIRSDRCPSTTWPGTPKRLTSPSAQPACVGLNPTSTRYFVWWTCTAYQAKSPKKYPTAIHQKRLVRIARSHVQSTTGHHAATEF